MDWKIVRCERCDHTFTNPRPNLESLASYYTETYFQDERHRDKFYNLDGTLKLEGDKYKNRIEDVENFCSERGNVLEIGAARGAFLKVLRERGWQVNGIEISEDAVSLAKTHNGIDLFCGVLEDFNPNERYNVICMYQTLEHVLQPDYVCKRSFELLKDSGKLIIEVPNRDCFEMKWSKRRRVLSYDLPRHISHFSPIVLEEYLYKIGFNRVYVYYYPDRFVLKVLNLVGSIKNNLLKRKSTENLNRSISENDSIGPIKMARFSTSLLSRILNKTSRIIPGWRFTIIAIK
jgi:2-polyprenyl-3-methyl-5-hydroxy-6-metoxy-1,4-benzoquinol methylase